MSFPRKVYRTHAYIGSWDRYTWLLVQWWKTGSSYPPGLQLVWRRRRLFTIGFRPNWRGRLG